MYIRTCYYFMYVHVFTVDCCCPGDMITITAIVKATGSDVGHGGRSSKDHCTFHLYLHAISISNDKLLAGGEPSASTHVEFSTKVIIAFKYACIVDLYI